MPYGITQCYLPPGTGDCPAFTPAEAGTQFSDLGGCKAELTIIRKPQHFHMVSNYLHQVLSVCHKARMWWTDRNTDCQHCAYCLRKHHVVKILNTLIVHYFDDGTFVGTMDTVICDF